MECDSIISDDESGSDGLLSDEEGAQQADNEEEDEEEEIDEPDDDDSGSGDEMSHLDEIELRRANLAEEVSCLEKEFIAIKNQLFAERLIQVESKLKEVREGRAVEYLSQLTTREENLRIRKQVAQIRRDFELESARNVFESEQQAAEQDFLNEKDRVYSEIKEEILRTIENIQKEQQTRKTLTATNFYSTKDNITADFRKIRRKRHQSQAMKTNSLSPRDTDNNKRDGSQPCLVYRIKPELILKDLHAIQQAAIKMSASWNTSQHSSRHRASTLIEARVEHKRLLYDGDIFTCGTPVVLLSHTSNTTDKVILSGLNADTVVFETNAGHKKRVPISHLKRSKVSLSRLI